jgi:hypothetical protein
VSSWRAREVSLPRTVSLTLSLRAFQHALSELVASPPLCLAVREGGADFFGRFDLSEMEKDRLLEVVWQRGMSVSCSMYRSNRVTPIYTLLNFTCVLLADGLKKELDEYWTSSSLPDLQFKQEIERFSQYLKRRIASGAITNPFLEEVLDFELAMNTLRYIPRRRILQRIRETPAPQDAGPLQLNPLIRVVRFRHEPFELLDLLRQKLPIPDQLPSGEFFVLLSAVEEQMDIKQLDAKLGNILLRIQADGAWRGRSDEFGELLLAGLVVPALPEEVDRESVD